MQKDKEKETEDAGSSSKIFPLTRISNIDFRILIGFFLIISSVSSSIRHAMLASYYVPGLFEVVINLSVMIMGIILVSSYFGESLNEKKKTNELLAAILHNRQ